MREHRKTRKLREYARELREHALDGEGGVAREGRERGAAHERKRGGRERAQLESARKTRRKARGKRAARAGTHQGSGGARGGVRNVARADGDSLRHSEMRFFVLSSGYGVYFYRSIYRITTTVYLLAAIQMRLDSLGIQSKAGLYGYCLLLIHLECSVISVNEAGHLQDD